jgi:hypothetical protein
MSSYPHLVATLHQATQILADPISNPAPTDPTGGSKGVNLLLAYAKWGSLIACALSAVVSGGMMGVGSLSNRPDSVDKGKRAMIWSLGGVLACAIAIPLVNQVFGAAA